MFRLIIICITIAFISTSATLSATSVSVKNFHKVDTQLYRCGQPQRKAMQEMEALGIKTIVNLRKVMNDKQEINGTQLTQVRIPMRAKKIDYQDILQALKAIKAAEKPVAIHCLHGSDRTGCIVAAYRMAFNDWPKEKAIKEFQQKQYGYNKRLFPNILELLQSLDIAQLKNDLNQ